MKKMKKLVPLLVAALLAASMSVGKAQTYPDRPIKMIVSIAAGSVTDVIMRTAAAELQQRLGKPLVIENLGGAYLVGTELKLSLALVIIVVVLVVKPTGLLGRAVQSRV